MPSEAGDRRAGGDRQEQRLRPHPAAIPRDDRIDQLRLYGKDDRIGGEPGRQIGGRAIPGDTGGLGQRGRRSGRLDDHKALGRTARQPAAQHRRAHLAATHEKEGIRFRWGRGGCRIHRDVTSRHKNGLAKAKKWPCQGWCHCERSEAISRRESSVRRDCFVAALLAMTDVSQASPIGSIIAVAIASSGGLPPQMTSWNAG